MADGRYNYELMARFVRVLVKRGHPTGTYRRGGFVFSVETPVDLRNRDVTDEIRNDPWLVCSEIDDREFTEKGVPVEREEITQEETSEEEGA